MAGHDRDLLHGCPFGAGGEGGADALRKEGLAGFGSNIHQAATKSSLWAGAVPGCPQGCLAMVGQSPIHAGWAASGAPNLECKYAVDFVPSVSLQHLARLS